MTKPVQHSKNHVNEEEPQGLLQVVPGNFNSYEKHSRSWHDGTSADQFAKLVGVFVEAMRKAARRERKRGQFR